MQKLLITKHNELIENFIFNATEVELQILNYAVSRVNPELEQRNNLAFKIHISELVGVFGKTPNNAYKLYREASDRLMKRSYSFFCSDRGEMIKENLVIQTREPVDKSYIVFVFNQHISNRITGLKEFFTSYDIRHISNFTSRYSFLLYEYFRMRLDLNRKALNNKPYHKEFSIEDFKEKLDISGKYKAFKDLKRVVIDPAEKQINKHSDIRITSTVKRKAKTVTHIVFNAQYKKGQAPTELTEDPTIKNQQELPMLDQAELKEPSEKAKDIINMMKDRFGK